MSARATVERLALRTDARGLVCEPASADELGAQRNVHVVTSAPGTVRGNHWHRRGTEILTVLGPALIRIREEGSVRDEEVAEGEAVRCVFPPGVAHAVRNTGTSTGFLIGFNTIAHDPGDPDVVREVLL